MQCAVLAALTASATMSLQRSRANPCAPDLLSRSLLAGGALVSAQQLQLPSEPPRQFGASITGAFEGWFKNPDGSYTLPRRAI